MAITAGTLQFLDAVRAGSPDAAILGMIKAGATRPTDGETDWQSSPLVLTCLQPAIWVCYSPVPTPVAELTERFAAVTPAHR